ncbi:MAG: mechanosensitive ion channel [Vicingaceae bacterium]
MEEFKVEDAYKLVKGKLENWLEGFIAMLPNLAVAILILIVFYFVARFVRKGVSKMLPNISRNKSLNHLIANVVYITVVVIGTFVALEVLELEKTVTSLLAGVGVIGLALGFAFQDTAANFVSGIIMAVRSPINIGDIIESGNVMGVVQRINLRATEVHTFQGVLVVIPNRDVFQNPLYNYTHSGMRRVDLECGISYGDDLEKVKEVSIAAIEKAEGIDTKKGVTFFFNGFGDSSINFVVRAWAKDIQQAGFLAVQSNMIISLKNAFDENDIMIPFPIRTLDFGIKGGEKLNSMLNKS